MEKNKQVLEFGDIIKEAEGETIREYPMLRGLFLDYLEYIGMSWENYQKLKSKKEIVEDYKIFSLYHYLPF